MENIRNILIRYWGYSSFRPLQEEIIRSVLEGRDTLALMPTGGGKSVCFQVPALAKEGLCLVITPLIALMKDQVSGLRKKGINAQAVYSGMHRNEIQMALDNCMFGDVKFLYLSPERLQTEQFRQAVTRMKVNLLAVDEAHCISQWGYDFRPPYLKIREVRQHLKGVPVLALTATATPGVIKDIQQKLGFSHENVLKKSFERKNLIYAVIKEEDKRGRLLRIFKKVPGTAIIYVRNRKKTEEVASFLKKNQVSADFYHAGLDIKVREKKQVAWMKEDVRVMVSTNAFGMGIDKPNVRCVVHLDLADSIEAYFQEAGRGGRDEKRAYAILLYQESDLVQSRRNLEKEYPPPEMIRNVYQALGNHFQLAVGSGKDESFDFEIIDFSRSFGFNPIIVYNSLKFLEREGYLSLNEATGNPSRIHFEMNRDDLYRYQVENKALDPFIKLILRSYAGVFTDFIPFYEAELAKRAAISKDEILRLLEHLHKVGVLTWVRQQARPQVTFLLERLDAKNLYISPENYEERKRQASARMQAVIDYTTSDSICRSQFLLCYFGETDAMRCGKCDICLERNKMALNDLEFGQIRGKLNKLLADRPMTLPELVFFAASFPEDKILKVIRWLEDKGIIIKGEDMKYIWNKQTRMRI